MRVWLVCFLGLFGLAELYQWAIAVPWLQPAHLPLSAFVGVALAIASNYNKPAGLLWQNGTTKLSASDVASDVASHVQPTPTVPDEQPAIAPQPSPQLPFFDVNLRVRRSISFTIRKASSSVDRLES
jgi:hypothetical protein